jgi:hypothetical protein
MNEIDHFNFFVLYIDDMIVDVDHLHVKRIHLVHLVGFSYIVIDDVGVESALSERMLSSPSSEVSDMK